MSDSRVSRVSGRTIVVPGTDIDTDRIMPARFLKAITFEGLEAHVFEDDRREAAARGLTHPFDDATRQGANILIVGSNFGCGSSREHAPQALVRWGIRAIVGESFAEIFFGNSLMLGLPCVQMSPPELAVLRKVAESPAAEVTVDLSKNEVSAAGITAPLRMPAPAREALLSGAWDATGMLLADYDEVLATANKLPYLTAFN